MLMLGMALLTHIRHKAQTARIVRSLRLSSASRPRARSMIRQSLTLLHKLWLSPSIFITASHQGGFVMTSRRLLLLLFLFSLSAYGQLKWYKFDKTFIDQHYSQDG